MTEEVSLPATQNAVTNANSLSRRARLRDFQAQLMERMQAARTGVVVQANQLGLLIGKYRYLVDLREAGEIFSLSNLTQVPLTRPWYLGVTSVRGSLISVVDFALFEAGETSIRDASTRVLSFSDAFSFNSGLLVNKVLGLRNIEDMQVARFTDDVEHNHQSKPWLLNYLLDAEGNVWKQISLSMLVNDQDFLHISA